MNAEALYGLGVSLIFIGIIVILAAIFWLFLSGTKGKVKGGGAIIIGPLPIVFGTDKESIKTVLLLSIVLTILLIIMIVTLYLTSR